LESGLDLRSANQNGFTSIHFAAANGKENVLKFLFENHFHCLVDLKTGLNPSNSFVVAYEDLEEKYPFNDCALHLAARFGHLSSVELLIESNADIDSRNGYGNTPLHVRNRL
jgi:ankyrin repeat protein